MKSIKTQFIQYKGKDQQATGNADRQPGKVGDGKRQILFQGPPRDPNIVSEHDGWFVFKITNIFN
jgi:hypothetical protein